MPLNLGTQMMTERKVKPPSKVSSEPISEDSWPGRIVDMAELGARLAKRRAELGNPVMPRNAGKNRTPSKIALLKAIEDAGGKW